MTEQKTAQRYAVTDGAGTVTSNRSHTFKDCASLREKGQAVEVNDREIVLLGLKPCMRCEKRAEGGPALEALTDIFTVAPSMEADEEAQARYVLDALSERGFYIGRKGVRKPTKSTPAGKNAPSSVSGKLPSEK